MLKRAAFIMIAAAALFANVSVSEAKTVVKTAANPVIEKETAYITGINIKSNRMYGHFDYIQWFFGKAADREFLKDCKCSEYMKHAPDMYYIRNVNPRIRTIRIANNAQYILQTYNDTIKWNQKVTKAQFLGFLKRRNKDHSIPFHLEIKNGIITKITEQYIP
jgi:hypothetical protein